MVGFIGEYSVFVHHNPRQSYQSKDKPCESKVISGFYYLFIKMITLSPMNR